MDRRLRQVTRFTGATVACGPPQRLIEELSELEAVDVQALAAALFDSDRHIDIISVLS